MMVMINRAKCGRILKKIVRGLQSIDTESEVYLSDIQRELFYIFYIY